MPALAIDKLKRLLGEQQIGTSNIEQFYALGLAYERLGNTAEAVATYRKIMTERYGYQDVEQRIARLSNAAPVAAPAAASPVASPLPPSAAPVPAPAASAAVAPAAAPALVRPPAPGSPPLQLGEELGKGLLGTTYRATDVRNQRLVVVKLLRPDLLRNRAVVQQFLAEAQAAHSLDHPNVIRLLGLVDMQGSKAVVTEFVEGFDLASFLSRSKRISVKQSVDLLTTISLALGYAHERNLFHRDLKPSNILVGKGGKLRIAGFGLGALRLRELGRADGYPSPEFLSGAAFDARGDIYALGAVIFHALTGLHPESPELSQNGSAPRLRQVVPAAPESLDQILSRCLARDPGERFASTGDLLAAARAVQV